MKKTIITLLTTIFFITGFGCQPKAKDMTLRMATTTSTDNTGLLDFLAPKIKQGTQIDLKWVAVGTGKALELGKNCDVDILFVHAPAAEKKYIQQGFGINRTQIMYNDFIIVGPQNDPASLKGKNVIDSFKQIMAKKTQFASRNDNSGTHKKERSLWAAAGLKVPDKEKWYIQTGQGMINTINIAAERDAYTMTDRGTYIKYESNHKGKPPLIIINEGDKELLNQYSLIEVNPARCKNTQNDLARRFIQWMVSPDAQKIIGNFKLIHKKLFTPNAKK